MIGGFSIAVLAHALAAEPRAAVTAARQRGFAGVQFDAISAALDFTALSITGRREFQHVLAHQNMSLTGLRDHAGPKGLGPGADADRLVSRWEGILESAAGLAAPMVCLELGPIDQPLPPDAAAAIIEVGRRADRYGVMIGLRSDLSPLAALKSLLDAAACPWLGVDFDPVAVLQDEWNLDQTLAQLGSAVRACRGRDALAGGSGRTQPAVVGAGSVDWTVLLASLDAAGFRGWINIDPMELADRPGAAAAALAHLRQL